MISAVVYLSIISIQLHIIETTTPEVTAAIETRIEILKREILEGINKKQNKPRAIQSDPYSDIYEYVDDENRPITPIMESDQRKLKDKFKLPEIKSTPEHKYIPSASSSESSEDKRPIKRNHKKGKKVSKPKDIFYRKMFMDVEEQNRPQKWTHCLDLITPYLNGYKDNMTSKHIAANDFTVVRLSHLLNMNVKDLTKEDIRSIMYQISNLQLRFFQWDINAMRTIFNVIIRNGTHDFRGLKYGMKRIFREWRIDLSDTRSLLTQSRIFRPPCVKVSELDGSTLTNKAKIFTTPTTKKGSSNEDC